MTQAIVRQGSPLLQRWLRAAWPGWVALALLLLVMPLVVKPRISQFVDYWYSVPQESALVARSTELRQSRTQSAVRYAWMIGAAPVALLLLVPLVLAFRTRADETAGELAAASSPHDTLDAGITVIRPAASPDILPVAAADQTLVRAPGVGEVIALAGAAVADAAMKIGPGGRYHLQRLLASGGMGSVHKAYDSMLRREVAIKELDVSLADDEEQTERFHQEALALAGLAHPYIVPVYDLVDEDNRFWIVMELLSGGHLDQRIERDRPTIKAAVEIIRDVAEGLAFAHNKGIVHRDIKPMNILFNSDGIPKLVDFGIAKLVQSQQSVVQTRDGLSLGSPTYMSPEQATGSKHIDKRTDIYALGITFYKLLTGAVPFTGEVAAVMAQHITQMPLPPQAINGEISDALNAVVMKMLQKDPADRFQSLEEFIAALDALQ